jgi:osmotically-inducible protein OsmY
VRNAFKWLSLGALVAYLADPQSGRRRRNMLRDRTLASFRRTGRKTARAGQGVAAQAHGITRKLTHLKEEQKPQADDTTLAQKVQTEIFRDVDVPKGQINVNAQDGVIQLRGEVPGADLIDDLVNRARKVQGVRDVENLLHLPGAPAPMHQ